MNVIQKIVFGPPGVGKSYYIRDTIKKNLNDENVFSTIFHPEYRYGDFVGKLLPYNENGNITYRYFRGPFLKALAKAYKNILDNEENPNVFLIIDEINRGNSAAIFGNIFQLLDRNKDGWSVYSIMISDLEWEEFLKEIGFEEVIQKHEKKFTYNNNIDVNKFVKIIKEIMNQDNEDNSQQFEENEEKIDPFKKGYLKLPPNFHIVATMNTSDESIYYMDSAFKRRWDWEYLDINGEGFINIQDKAFNWDCLESI